MGGDDMAEFCLDCLNKINGTNYDESKYIISDDLDLCEGCGEWKPVVVAMRRSNDGYWLRYAIYHIIEKLADCIHILFRRKSK